MRSLLIFITLTLSFSAFASENACEEIIEKMTLAMDAGDASLVPDDASIKEDFLACQSALIGTDDEADIKEKYKARTKATKEIIAATQVLCPIKQSQGSRLLMALCYRDMTAALYSAAKN
jgi:hypothetical protein